ncbi:hypothetical protein FRX31_029892 [Thalictrum thalictroides]|uniref:Uncharacterized protein n=1 Tax=Thalictrum thalictroides TaxID=46969 RepID=A0A7J6V7F6_THATH|nr:hypothetical protein FRX31_029892 [Thalictrum thalictroides]
MKFRAFETDTECENGNATEGCSRVVETSPHGGNSMMSKLSLLQSEFGVFLREDGNDVVDILESFNKRNNTETIKYSRKKEAFYSLGNFNLEVDILGASEVEIFSACFLFRILDSY